LKIYCTRHGRGGGWYDRFLSKIPRSWVRIGVVGSENFYHKRIKKQEHDEVMDWIIIKENSKWNTIKPII
jgi:5-formyltetrahydrofolate cyclo-ligase